MSFLWNYFTSSKETKPKKQEEKDIPDINNYAFDFTSEDKKETKITKEKKEQKNNNKKIIPKIIERDDNEPIEEINKDSIDQYSDKINDNNTKIKEQPKKEIIIEEAEENKEKENEIILNNNTGSKGKKTGKKKIKKVKKENNQDKNTNLNVQKEEDNKIIILEEKKDENKYDNLISDNSINNTNKVNKEENQIIEINKKDLNNKKIVLNGPENSPYENGKFEIAINYENNDDLKPVLKFLTKIYHYNIAQKNGELLCPFVWNEKNNEEENIKNIKALLLRPDTRFPCSKFIKDEYYNNYPSYKEKAQKFTENYAMN